MFVIAEVDVCTHVVCCADSVKGKAQSEKQHTEGKKSHMALHYMELLFICHEGFWLIEQKNIYLKSLDIDAASSDIMKRVINLNDKTFDISTVCNLLGTTSRTLRFYEEKQIISSTRAFDSPRRQYTTSQIEQIRNVLVLRSLGLSVNEIRKLQKNGNDLLSAIELNKAKIYALIAEKTRTINLMNEALALIDNGKDVFESAKDDVIAHNDDNERIAKTCTDAIITDDSDMLYTFFSKKLKSYMPKDVYKSVRADMLRPLGAFVDIDRTEIDHEAPNVILQYVKYEKLGLRIKYVFYGGSIAGLWFNYYEK